MAARARPSAKPLAQVVVDSLKHLETAVKSGALKSTVLDAVLQLLGFLQEVRSVAVSTAKLLRRARSLPRGTAIARAVKLCFSPLYSLSWMLAHDVVLPYYMWALPCYKTAYTWLHRLARLVLAAAAVYESYRRLSCAALPFELTCRGFRVQLLSPEVTRKSMDLVQVLESAGLLLLDLNALAGDYPWLRLVKRGHSQNLRWLIMAYSTPRLETWLRKISCIYMYTLPLVRMAQQVLSRLVQVLGR